MTDLRKRVTSRDEGFTLIEVIVAMFVVVLVMASLLGVLVSSIETIAQARHRQTATALATQALERLRALPYDQVTQTDGSAPEGGIEYVVPVATAYAFRPTAVLPGVDEPLVVNALSAHWEDQTVGEVRYRVQVYVTRAPTTSGGEQPFNLYALVSWTSAADNGVRRVAERSVAYSPAGCLSTAQSPFAAPCQAYFTAQSGQALGGVTVTNEVDATAPVPGFEDGRRLDLTLSSNASSLLVEQTASANADAQTTGARRVGATESTTGTAVGSASVDSDPSSAPDQEDSATTGSHSSGAVALQGTAGRLVARPAGSDSGQAWAEINGDATHCISTSGAGFATGTQPHPCASSMVRPSSTPASLDYEPEGTLGFGALTVPMVSVPSTGAAFRSVSAQLTQTSTAGCTTGAGPQSLGCAFTAANRALGAVQVGSSAGASTVPAGWVANKPVWQITGLTESARAEEGAGARAPEYVKSGMLEVWDGTSFVTVDLGCYDLTPCAAPDNGASRVVTIPATTVEYTGGGGHVLSVTYEGAVTVQRPTVVRTPAIRTGVATTDCKTEACVSQINGGAGVVGNLTVVVARDGTEIARYALSTNLSGLVAQATYKAAPNA
ncbi:type IV pilus modification PilV family protein [Actinotalea solisilvae]|uniref:type IV pilus modification PilV family protein n=1 Tax=Actinotalea solisilvae TaxID=2072922 RepID=UPI0018F165DA|nr:prepilin-type N-terminal cleavage/methylation domain-containing protein [Actinotalea solisilvae]